MNLIIEKDENGQVIYEKYPNGLEYWYERNLDGVVIYYRNSNGYEHRSSSNVNVCSIRHHMIPTDSESWEGFSEFDSEGNIIYTKTFNFPGYECRYDFDLEGNIIHQIDTRGYEKWTDYDSNNRLIHDKDSRGYELWWMYGPDGKLIHSKNSTGKEKWYDENGAISKVIQKLN